MKYLKIFEAYSIEDYQKALNSIKDMVSKNKSSEDILAFINVYYSDSAKKLNELRIMLDRIERKYVFYRNYLIYNRKTETIRKRGGESENKNTYDKKQFYMFNSHDKPILVDFLSNQKKIYDKNINEIDDINTDTVKFLINKLFEILDWVNETGVSKKLISLSAHAGDVLHPRKTDEDVLREIESLNDMDFENEVEEVSKIIRRCKIQIKNAINSE